MEVEDTNSDNISSKYNVDKGGMQSNIESNKKPSFVKRFPVLITIIIGVLGMTIIYFWKTHQAKNERGTLENMANEHVMQNDEAVLKLLSKPLVWSIRSELLRGNLEQVDIYTTELVREKNFQFIYLIRPSDSIIVSTDKKLQGQLATNMFDKALLRSDSITLVRNTDSSLTVFAPVMGYDSRLATLVYKYTPALIRFNEAN